MVGLQRGPDLKQPNFRPRVAGKKARRFCVMLQKLRQAGIMVLANNRK